MKKTLAFVLSFLLTVNLLASACLTFATGGNSDTYDDHLVVHYDFKGDTVAEALKDKATAGKVADDLDAYTPTNKNSDPTGAAVTPDAADSDNFKNSFAVDLEKGTATNLVQQASLQAPTSEDIQKLYGTATWFFRFKVEDVSAATTNILEMRLNAKGGRMFAFLVSQEGKLHVNYGRTTTANSSRWFDEVGLVTNGTYINFAVAMQKNTESDTMMYVPYVAIGTPTSSEDWIALTATGYETFRAGQVTVNPLSLFDRWDCAGYNNTGVTLHDVRLYDTVLGKSDISAIFAKAMANGEFDSTASSETPDAPTNPPVTPDTPTPEKPEPPVIPEKDENEQTPNLGEHLVVHYDFKGETAAEALKDKATAGEVKDDLAAYSAAHKNTDYTGGEFDDVNSDAFADSFYLDYQNGTITNLDEGATLQAVSSTDIQKLYGTATWFFRFKLDEVDWSETRLLDMRLNDKGSCMFSILIDTNGNIFTKAGRTASAQNVYTYSTGTNGVVTNQVYVNFALVMIQGNGSSGYTNDIKYIPYFSIETPEGVSDWISLAATDFVAFRPDGLLTNPLSLFDRWDGVGSNNIGLTIDDVRLYDTTLTKADLQAIIEAGGFADPNADNGNDENENENGGGTQNPNEQPDNGQGSKPNTDIENKPNETPDAQQTTEKTTAETPTANAPTQAPATENKGGCMGSVPSVMAVIVALGGGFLTLQGKEKKRKDL